MDHVWPPLHVHSSILDGLILDHVARYRLGHTLHSVNLPHVSALQPDGSLTPSPAASTLAAHRGRVLIVLANKGEAGPIVRLLLHLLAANKVATPAKMRYEEI